MKKGVFCVSLRWKKFSAVSVIAVLICAAVVITGRPANRVEQRYNAVRKLVGGDACLSAANSMCGDWNTYAICILGGAGLYAAYDNSRVRNRVTELERLDNRYKQANHTLERMIRSTVNDCEPLSTKIRAMDDMAKDSLKKVEHSNKQDTEVYNWIRHSRLPQVLEKNSSLKTELASLKRTLTDSADKQ